MIVSLNYRFLTHNNSKYFVEGILFPEIDWQRFCNRHNQRDSTVYGPIKTSYQIAITEFSNGSVTRPIATVRVTIPRIDLNRAYEYGFFDFGTAWDEEHVFVLRYGIEGWQITTNEFVGINLRWEGQAIIDAMNKETPELKTTYSGCLRHLFDRHERFGG